MKQLYIIFSFVFAATLLSGCYEDKSTTAEVFGDVVFTFPEQYVQKDGTIKIEISNGSVLSLNPDVKQPDIANSDLSYEWKVSIYTTGSVDATYSLLSNTKELQRQINLQPASAYYMLLLTVTDNRTGVKYLQPCKLYVTSGLGDGVIVADTKDNITGDLSLVRSSAVSRSYTAEPVYMRNFYSLNNNKSYDGVIKSVQQGIYGAYSSKSFPIYVMSSKNIGVLNSSTYSTIYPTEKLMLGSYTDDFTSFGGGGNFMYAVCGTDIFFTTHSQSFYQFGDPANYVKPSLASTKKKANKYALIYQGLISFISADTGILYISGGFSTNYAIVVPTKGPGTDAYEPSMFAGYTEIGSYIGAVDDSGNNEHIHVMKAADNSIGFYGYRAVYNKVDQVFEYNTTRACAATSCADIADAFIFDGCYSRDVAYYATKSKVYAAILGASSASSQSVFTAPSGCEITSVKVFHEAWSYYDTSSDEVLPGHDNQVMIAVYNTSSGEGTLYILPIKSVSGILDEVTPERTYTGFGRITALGTQSKQ